MNDAEYVGCIKERQIANTKGSILIKQKWTGQLPDRFVDKFDHENCVKLRLKWATETDDGCYTDTMQKGDQFVANKENKPDQNHNRTNIADNSHIMNGCAIHTNGLVNTNASDDAFHMSGVSNNNSTNVINNNISVSSNRNIDVPNGDGHATLLDNGSQAIVKVQDIASRIIYQFVYNNNSTQQTEPFDNFTCPWCTIHCLTLYALLKHLKLCHARFNFAYVPLAHGIRVDVSINSQFGSSSCVHDPVVPVGVGSFSRGGSVRRNPVTQLLVCHPRRHKPSLQEFIGTDDNEIEAHRPYITGHTRQYHHTVTCLPITVKELQIDSEDETDPAWLQHKTMQMLDDFTDVNEGEKDLMKMWNLHIMSKGYVGDVQIVLACNMFINLHGEELLRKNLYRNFLLHLCNLYDYGLLSAKQYYDLLGSLRKKLAEFEEGQQVMADRRKKHMIYWAMTGLHRYHEMQQQQHAQASASKSHRKVSQAVVETSGRSSHTQSDADQEEIDVHDVIEQPNHGDRVGVHGVGNVVTSKKRRLDFNSYSSSSSNSADDMHFGEKLAKRRQSTPANDYSESERAQPLHGRRYSTFSGKAMKKTPIKLAK